LGSTVSNGRIFEEPVFNYTRDFPYLWEEMQVPVSYKDDRAGVEQIRLEVARRDSIRVTEVGHEALGKMRDHYFVRDAEFEPKAYLRITDNWVELTVRFVVNERGARDVKDTMSRESSLPSTRRASGSPPAPMRLSGCLRSG
jgi:small-conductance mechanosensitive channel